MQSALCPNLGGKASKMMGLQQHQQARITKTGTETSIAFVSRPVRVQRRQARVLGASSGRLEARGRIDEGSDYGRYWTQDENEAIVNYARRRFSATEAVIESSPNPLSSFIDKVRRAWQIFFPPQPQPLNAREEGKNRLRMILVADRCGLSPNSLSDMKESIMDAVSEFVEIDSDDEVEISMTSDDNAGLIYSVAVPVRRVKPDKRAELLAATGGEGGAGGIDPEDGGFEREEQWDEDPAARFPYGT